MQEGLGLDRRKASIVIGTLLAASLLVTFLVKHCAERPLPAERITGENPRGRTLSHLAPQRGTIHAESPLGPLQGEGDEPRRGPDEVNPNGHIRLLGRVTQFDGSSATGTRIVVFRVIERQDGSPDPIASARATADFDGSWEVEIHEPGRHWVFAYCTPPGNLLVAKEVFVTRPATEVDLALDLPSSIRGRVIDSRTGLGIPGAAVTATNEFFLDSPECEECLQFLTTGTDANGTFSLEGIQATIPRLPMTLAPRSPLKYLLAFKHPDYDLHSVFVDIPPARVVTLLISMDKAQHPVCFIVVVMDQDSEPIADASILPRIIDSGLQSGQQYPRFVTDTNGVATLTIQAPVSTRQRLLALESALELLVAARGYRVTSIPLRDGLPQQNGRLEVTLARGNTISGRLLSDSDRRPVARTRLCAIPERPNWGFAVPSEILDVLTVETDDEGAFRIEGLDPGWYMLRHRLASNTEPSYTFQPRRVESGEAHLIVIASQ